MKRSPLSLNRFGLPLLAVLIVVTAIYSEMIAHPTYHDGKIHVIYWEKWTDFEGDAIRKTVEAFNRSQNRIHVDLLTVSGIENKTLLAIAGGDPPDVAGLYGPNVAQYADDNAIIPLDSYCKRYGLDRNHFIPVFWDMGHYHGHQYALPSTPATTALHYNMAMLQAAGITHPPQTIEELDADAAKITTRDANGNIQKVGFLPTEPGWWNWAWGYFFGGKLWNGTDKITATDPGNVRAYQWIQSYSKKYGPGNLQSFRSGLGTFSSPQNGFLDEKVAMELQGVWMYNFISRFAPQMEKPKRIWGVVPFPYPADRPDLANTSVADEDVLVIPRGAKHPNAAFAFIRFIESRKGSEMLCGLQRKFSPLRHVDPRFYATHPNPYIKLFVRLAYSKNVITPPKMGIWPEYGSALSNAIDEVTLMEKTPEQALEEVQQEMQPKLDEYLRRLHLRQKAMHEAQSTPAHGDNR